MPSLKTKRSYMNTVTYPKIYFKGFSKVKLNRWILKHRKELSCGALFTYSSEGISPLIKKVTKKYARSSFCPTHVGQIIQVGQEIMVFNQIPPKGELSLLSDYIFNASFDFEIVTFLDNNFDGFQYSKYVLTHNGEKYGYFSAVQSGIKCLRWIYNHKRHCSEIQCLALQHQGFFKYVKADDQTPIDVYNLLVYGGN